MKRGLWHRWTVDKPAALGDWLWDVFVVQLAAWLDRLTLRKIIAFIPVVILVLAYMHRIPIPPELLLVGDLLAYIDVFAMIFLLGMIARVETVVYVLKRATELAIAGASGVLSSLRRLDFRHRRASGENGRRKRDAVRRKQSDGDGDDVLIGLWQAIIWRPFPHAGNGLLVFPAARQFLQDRPATRFPSFA